MATTNNQKKDHWNSKDYNSTAGFVPKLTNIVVSWLDPQPTDKILDLGCGDGSLTSQVAASAKQVLGVDASKSFIETAKAQYSRENCTYLLHDCNELEGCEEAVSGNWDKVFSNAAMHWILRREETRKKYFENVNKCLKKGGTFAFEMGGKGNVAEIHTATTAALRNAGIPLDKAREASPWFFPSDEWMKQTLEECGFEVEKCELVYRPTLTEKDRLEGWVKLMCAEQLEVLPEGKREGAVREICELIDAAVTREEDGSKYLGYVRLRGLARKK